MRCLERRGKVNPRAGWTRPADGRDGDCFLVRGCPHGELVAHRETVGAADFDVGRPGARISRQRRAVRLRADVRDRDRLDPMADAIDVQPDLVAHRDVGDRRHLDVRRPAGASTPRKACVPGLPTAVTVATSYRSVAFPTLGYVAPCPMPIFWPTSKPPTLVTGTLDDPTGVLITGPSGSGCQTVVGFPAGVPTLTILRVSTPEPVSMVIVSPALMAVVLLT